MTVLNNNGFNDPSTTARVERFSYGELYRGRATLCLDDSIADSWHSLNQPHEVVTWNAFISICLTFFWLLHDTIRVISVLMSSLLFWSYILLVMLGRQPSGLVTVRLQVRIPS
jgi:hypothetical protein